MERNFGQNQNGLLPKLYVYIIINNILINTIYANYQCCKPQCTKPYIPVANLQLVHAFFLSHETLCVYQLFFKTLMQKIDNDFNKFMPRFIICVND